LGILKKHELPPPDNCVTMTFTVASNKVLEMCLFIFILYVI
jgi:hypothetical protein